MTQPRFPRGSRRGAAALETAIVLPIFLLLLFGIIEFGRVVMLYQVTTNACREAARRAIVPGATSANVTTTCNQLLTSSNIRSPQVSVLNSSGTAVSVSSIPSHEAVTVRISVPFNENTWGLTRWFLGETLTSEVTMRRE